MIKAQELADLLSAIGGFVGDGRKVVRMTDIAAELRRLNAIEAERDALRAEVERLRAARSGGASTFQKGK